MYKPKVVSSSSEFGIKGGAMIAWNADHSKVQITIGDKKTVFPAKALPFTKFPTGEYFVQLSKDEDEVLAIRPNNGMFVVKVDRFISKKDADPAPETKSYNFEGKDISYQAFSVMLKILSPAEFAGMELLLSLRYNFEGVQDTYQGKEVELVAFNHPKSKYTPFLQDFCEASGVWDKGPMKWSANILPVMAKRIAQADKKFQVVVKDGWVVTIFAMPDVTESDFDDEEKVESKPDPEDDEFEAKPDVLKTEDDDDNLNWE